MRLNSCSEGSPIVNAVKFDFWVIRADRIINPDSTQKCKNYCQQMKRGMEEGWKFAEYMAK
jgi:hypothetical protein